MPFAATRGSSYRDLLPRDVRTRAGASAAAVLPFPVIGVPWYLSATCRECCWSRTRSATTSRTTAELTAELAAQPAIAGLPADRVAVWKPWLGEVFADVVASVTCGTAYGAGAGRRSRRGAARGRRRALPAAAGPRAAEPGRRPARRPARRRRSAGRRRTARRAWRGGHGGRVGDRGAVGGPYDGLDGISLQDVLRHSDTARARTGAASLLAGLRSGLSEVRAVLPAAALAFLDDPAVYDRVAVGRRAIDEVLELRPKGARGLALGDQRAREERDAVTGRLLLDLLGGG